MLGKPEISAILHVGQELHNAVDKFAPEGGPKQQNSQSFTVRVLTNFVVSARGEKITANACTWEWRFLFGWCSFVRVK